MKKILALCIVMLTLFSACQQDSLMEDSPELRTRAVNEEVFDFSGSYLRWDENVYMLDYSIVGIGSTTLDAPITIQYIVYSTKGNTKEFQIQIPAGVGSYSMDQLILGGTIASEMGLGNNDYVESIKVLPYRYSGNMTIKGLDNLN